VSIGYFNNPPDSFERWQRMKSNQHHSSLHLLLSKHQLAKIFISRQ